MDDARSTTVKLLSHPILWGVFALLTLAIALSGKLSVTGATVVLWIAWGAAVVGIYTALDGATHKLVKFSVSAVLAIVFAVGAVALQRWFAKKPEISSTAVSSPPTESHPAQSQQKASPPIQPKTTPYFVTVDITTYSEMRSQYTFWWTISDGPKTEFISPVNAALFVSIHNNQNFPSMLSSYEVMMRTADHSWAPLISLYAQAKRIYFGSGPAQLHPVTDPSIMLDNLLYNQDIPAHATKRGWLLFEYPKEFGPTFVPEYKVTLTDFSGQTYTSPILSSSPKHKSGMQGASIPYGPSEDHSRDAVRYWTDSQVDSSAERTK